MSLPSGLGAGGRGKEKAPCRYLHYEVDWDENDAAAWAGAKEEKGLAKKPYRIGIGMGPYGKNMQVVCGLLAVLQPFTDGSVATATMGELRYSTVRLFSTRQIPCYHGRPAMGHPHECMSLTDHHTSR